jgi:hypothetical protein
MSAVTIESLGIDPEIVAEYRLGIANEYRIYREVGCESPLTAASNVRKSRAAVMARGWANRGTVNEFSGLAYLIACEWCEAARRLTERRLARRAVAA